MKNSDFQNFQEFWPFYLMEHSHPTNRRLHFIGTGTAILLLILILASQSWVWLWALLLVGYGFAWVGHFVIQKNRPATFKYPLWSLMGDFKMFYCILTGKINDEYAKIKNS
ncbi:MAG: DUF962 domain-containing protein [Bdellovibrio sp. CG10_big_fil_rev_8_21_14_0_10_47_8]|nr:MAG: DUF962 domain-containing protein [Bdellovibrio sp. CG10_big_fil_rev_8_21_14_0_10_47_8]